MIFLITIGQYGSNFHFPLLVVTHPWACPNWTCSYLQLSCQVLIPCSRVPETQILDSKIAPCSMFCSLGACIAWAPVEGDPQGVSVTTSSWSGNWISQNERIGFLQRMEIGFLNTSHSDFSNDDGGGTGQRNAVTRLNSEAVKCQSYRGQRSHRSSVWPLHL